MIRRRLWARRSDDRGTSLVLALIFVTVGSLVIMAVLGLVDANVRGTIQLSSEASMTAAAEGAANIAINDIRNWTFGGASGGPCFNPSLPTSNGGNTRLLANFYQRPDQTLDSAAVTCDWDASVGTSIAPYGTPSRALLTLDPTVTSGTGGPIGIWVTNTLGLTVGSLRTTGGIVSNSNIVVQPKTLGVGGNLTSSTTIQAVRACSSGSGLFTPPTPTCNTNTPVTDPLSIYPRPVVAGLPNRTVPACAPVMTLPYGHYGSPNAATGLNTALALSALTSTGCLGGNGVLLFQPGIYYFEFGPPDSAVAWTMSAGTVIGGALRPGVTAGPTMPVPNSCVSPVPTTSGGPVTISPNDGVTFVFSGGSWMDVISAARVEICGRYGGFGPPLAIYAEPAMGALGSACTASNWPCAAVVTGVPVIGVPLPAAFQVEGTIYTPQRELVLNLNNSSAQNVRGGVVVHRIWANTTRTTPTSVIDTQADVNAQRRTVVWLNVYLCPGSSSCTASGTKALRAKVSIVDPSGVPVVGQRKVTVLSWSLLP
jgi:hypothetical protein